MSEQNLHIPTIKEAHDQAYDAVAFAVETGAPQLEMVHRDVTTKVIDHSIATTNDVKLDYRDHDTLRSLAEDAKEGQESDYREIRAEVKAPQGRYAAASGSGTRSYVAAGVGVGRKGYSHQFKPENQEKAAALITSLAARRLGSQVLEHTNNVARAKETYLKKIKVQQPETPAEPVEVHHA